MPKYANCFPTTLIADRIPYSAGMHDTLGMSSAHT